MPVDPNAPALVEADDFPPCAWCSGPVDRKGYVYNDKPYCKFECYYEQMQKDQNYGRKPGEAGGVDPDVKEKIERHLAAVPPAPTLPTDAAERKGVPMFDGLLSYFPAALAEVARVSKKGNDQHNPGEPLHWARGKSTDEANCLVRHLLEHGTIDSDGLRHSAKMAWRALALLQKELEAAGAPLARGAKL